VKLKELIFENVEQVRQWRNKCFEALRTPFLLTKEMQEQFYKDVICNRNAHARYWGVWETKTPDAADDMLETFQDLFKPYDYFIGMVGLENIEWENRRSEISIILNPEYRGKGYGEQAVDMLLEQGFMYLNLDNIWGICYYCNPAFEFWKKIIQKHYAFSIELPSQKFWKGQYYFGLYFNISKEEWIKCRKEHVQ